MPNSRSTPKIWDGPTDAIVTTDIFAFLTTDANAAVFAIHPKAMPVILTTQEQVDVWMSAPWSEAAAMQKRLPEGALKIVARGLKLDGPDA